MIWLNCREIWEGTSFDIELEKRMADNQPRRLLALDPSSTSVGWAIFDEQGKPTACGVHRSSIDNFSRRCQKLAEQTMWLLKQLSNHEIVAEVNAGRAAAWNKSKGGRSPQSAATLSQGQGYLLGYLGAKGYMVETVTDKEWCKNVNKEKRAARIQREHPQFASVWETDKGFDATDAVGLGAYFVARRRERELLSRATTMITRLPKRRKAV